MSEKQHARHGSMHAVLHEVETGLYRAQYSGEINPENADEREIPDSHIGTDPNAVKHWVEAMAISLGYENVVWDEQVQE